MYNKSYQTVLIKRTVFNDTQKRNMNAQHGFAAIGADEYIINLLALISNKMKVKL